MYAQGIKKKVCVSFPSFKERNEPLIEYVWSQRQEFLEEKKSISSLEYNDKKWKQNRKKVKFSFGFQQNSQRPVVLFQAKCDTDW